MPSGNRNRKGKRERGRESNGGTPNHSKAAQPSGDRRTPTTTDNGLTWKLDNELISKLGTDTSLKSCIPKTTNVHHANEEEEIAAAICWICAEPIKYYSLPSCNHRTCHVCALRLRVLYEKVECTFCKEPQSTVIFTTSPDANFSSYNLHAIPHRHAKLSIFFETEDMMEEALKLLRFNCPSIECNYAAFGWGDLKLHARAVHGKVFCNLCIRSKKVFTHEHALYLPNVLPLHLPSMPNRSRRRPSDETVECGIHPLCAFCNECFFGDDELFAHMREQHEECFICRRNEIRYQYFQNYDALEQHFSQAHFACADSVCQAQKFVVFDTELDLNVHRLEAHAGDMSPKDRREARRVTFNPHGIGFGNGRVARDSADRQRQRVSIPQVVQTQGVVFGMSEGTRVTQHSAPGSRVASAIAPMPDSPTIESSAHDLISTVWNTLDQNLQDTAKIIGAVIDFLGEEEKKYNLLAVWDEYEVGSEKRYHSYDPDSTSPVSRYADITNVCLPSNVGATSPRVDQLDHHAVQPGSPSSPSSPPVPTNSVPTSAFPDTWESEAFPVLVRPRAKSTATPQSHQSHKSKSWASVAALPHLPSSPTASKKADAPRQSPTLSGTDAHPSLPSAGPSVDSNVAPAYYYPYLFQSPNTWASFASTQSDFPSWTDLSAWAPSWNTEGGGSAISETTMGQGKKGKGKQKQRLASGSFSF